MKRRELRRIARLYAAGQVFTSDDVSNFEDLGLIFPGLWMMDEETMEEFMSHKPALIYGIVGEDYVFPRSVNGMPMFGAFRHMNNKQRCIFKRMCLWKLLANSFDKEGFWKAMRFLPDAISNYLRWWKRQLVNHKQDWGTGNERSTS